MTTQQGEELERIRYYMGTISDFKSFWDSQAGGNSNAYDSPERQGYDVHPTRKSVGSPHWDKLKPSVAEGQDLDLGHTDDEAGMMASDLMTISRYAADLEQMLSTLGQSGQEIDFPHWWQSKIVLAKEYMVTAKHYLRNELEKQNAGLPKFSDFR
jgi:hypothetical protein